MRKLLAHIERLNYAGAIDIIVVDNDAEGRAGAAVVEEIAPTFRFPLTCIVEPRRGQTYAYNRAFVQACRSTPAPDYVGRARRRRISRSELADRNDPDRAANTTSTSSAVRCFPVFDEPDHWLAKSGLYAPNRYTTGRCR